MNCRYRFVHVAGTHGQGESLAMVDSGFASIEVMAEASGESGVVVL